MTTNDAYLIIADFLDWHMRESIRNHGKIKLTDDARIENGYWIWKGHRIVDLQEFIKKELSKFEDLIKDKI